MNQRAALVQPHSTEAEMSVLGSMMLDSSALEKVVEILQPEDFYHPAHQILYGAMLSLHERNYAVDLLTVQEELRRHGQLEEAGGLPALVNIVESVPTAANAEHYARIVKEKAILRRLLRAAHEIVRLVEEPELEVQQILDQAEHAIYQVAEQRLGREFAEVGHLIVDVMGHLEERQQHLQEHPGEFLQGVSTGFRELDWILSGLKPSELIILAARPSVGKTSLAVNIAEHVAIRERKAVAVFSLEMSAEQLVQRMLCSQAGVNAQRLRRLQLNQDEWNLLTRAAERLFQAQIYIDDTSSLSPIEMRAKCRRLKSQASRARTGSHRGRLPAADAFV
jgi:replicative DNA helicase